MQGHATRRQVLAGVLAPRVVHARTDAGRTWAAEGHGRRLIFRETRNRTDPISGFAKNGDVSVFLVLTLGIVNLVAEHRDRIFLWCIITLAWIMLLPFTAFVNEIFPFAGSGDDESYFHLGAATVQSLGEAFDLTRFLGSMEQPGYPWLLSILH